MERDFALRFCEETYLTSDEIKNILNTSSIELIWEKVLKYRNLYRVNLDIYNSEDKFYYFTFTRSLMKRLIKCERKLTSLTVSFQSLPLEEQKKIVNKQLFIIARTYSTINSLTIDNQQINDLIYSKTVEIPQAFRSLRNYLNLIKNYMFNNVDSFKINDLADIYGQFIRRDLDANDYFFRETDLLNPDDHLEKNQHYDAAPLDKITSMIGDLLTMINNEDSPFIKAAIALYYLSYIVSFNYFNEECNLITFKYLLGGKDCKFIIFLLNFEKYFLEYSNSQYKESFLKSEMSLDLTYFLNYVLDIYEKALNDFDADEVKFVKKDYLSSSSDEYIEKKDENVNLSFEKKVAVPILPQGLSKDEKELVSSSLVELYPSIKLPQARFYAEHCTIGKYYTIAQYKKEMSVAYETARTSMDNLAYLGLYKKEKIKNKFVYTPMVINKEE